MRCYFVCGLALFLLSCASLDYARDASEQPTTFVVSDQSMAGNSEMKTTDLPGMDSKQEAPRPVFLRWFFGGH